MNELLAEERYLYLSQPGNLSQLADKLSEESGKEYSTIIRMFHKAVESELSDRENYVFRMYYLYGKSIINITYELGSQYVRIENNLKKGYQKLLKFFKNYSEE